MWSGSEPELLKDREPQRDTEHLRRAGMTTDKEALLCSRQFGTELTL